MREIILISFLVMLSTAVNAERIVSVGGGVTEIICELGACDSLVGVDTTSQFPESVKSIAKVGYMRALSVEGLASLKPDIVFLTSDAGPPSSIDQLKLLNIRVITLNSEASVEGLILRIHALGRHLNKEKKAQALVQQISNNRQELDALLSLQAKNQGRKLSALFILSHSGRTLSIAGKGTSAHSLLSLAGLDNAAGQFNGYRTLGQEGIAKMDPDIIITTEQGVQAWGGADKILQQQGVRHTSAAKEGKLIYMDAMYLLGFGPRVLQAAEELHQNAYRIP